MTGSKPLNTRRDARSVCLASCVSVLLSGASSAGNAGALFLAVRCYSFMWSKGGSDAEKHK